MKLISLTYIIFLFSCNSIKNQYEKYKGFATLYKNKTTVLISCIKCNCIIDELNIIYDKDSTVFNDLDVLMDTTCKVNLNKKISINYIPQSKIDSISTDFYNMLIIKKDNKIYNIETKESSKLYSFLK
jgi:hypothetical protein